MNLTELSIKKPVFAWMLMLAFIIFGSISFSRMGISDKPDIDFPVVNINVNWEGAAPEVMELDIVDPLESALLGVEGIKSISSDSKRGQSNITLEFGLDKNVDVAVQEIQAILGQAQRNLPSDIETPTVRKTNPEDRPIIWLSVRSDKMERKELMTYVRDNIKDRFQTIKGVSEINLGGYVEPNLRVWLSEDKLRKFDLTAMDILNTITSEHSELPSGIFENETTLYNIRTLGEAYTLDEFAKLSINRRGGSPNFNPIPLIAVAKIEDGLEDVRRFSRVNGKSSIGLGIKKQRGVNTVEVANLVKQRMSEIAKELPEGAEIGVNYDGSVFIEEAVDELEFTLILSAVMTALVIWFFLGSWTSTFNIALSIPTAIIGTFIALKFFGFTLNTFTMLGLTMAVGVIVDDNIMILENIYRKHSVLKDKIKASLDGTNEIKFAALAASTAIVAIFLPIAFMDGIIGKYFAQFAITISVAIGFSYIDAITLTPMRTSVFIEENSLNHTRWIDRKMLEWEEQYRKILEWSLQNRKKIILISILVLMVTGVFYFFIKKEFVPAQDQSRLMIMLKTPPGSSLQYTDEKVKEIESILLKEKEIERYFVSVGGFSGAEANSAMSFVTLYSPDKRPVNAERKKRLSQQEFADYLKVKLSEVKGIFSIIQDPSLSGFSAGRSYPIEFDVVGANFDKLIAESERVKEEMLKSGLMVEVDSSYKGKVPEIRIIPNRDKAIARGVSIEEIGKTIQSMISGVVAGKFAKGGRRYDIRLKIEDRELKAIEDLEKIRIRNNRGELISLSEVTSIKTDTGLLSIFRNDRRRTVSLYSNVPNNVSQGEAIEYVTKKIKPNIDPSVTLVEAGTSKEFAKTFKSFLLVFVIGILIAYMLLASQFNSLLHPVTILSALPFSVTGAIITLWATGHSLNIYSLIGLILLMGIVKKNSIILVDYTNQLRAEGLAVKEALVKACPIRLRPIIMTSVSTIAGTLPAALALGPGAETRVPMALAIIGGVLLSTLLTLIVIPCIYLMLSPYEKSAPISTEVSS